MPQRTSIRRSCNINKALEMITTIDDPVDSSTEESESEITIEKEEVHSDFKEGWLARFNQTMLSNYSVDSLLLYHINLESYKYFYGVIKEEKYELLKKLVKEYQELTTPKLNLSSYRHRNNKINSRIKFYNLKVIYNKVQYY